MESSTEYHKYQTLSKANKRSLESLCDYIAKNKFIFPN